MTQIDKLKIVLKEQEEKNEELFKQSSWCRQHNFKIQADILFDKYQSINDVLRHIRMKVVDEILDV